VCCGRETARSVDGASLTARALAAPPVRAELATAAARLLALVEMHDAAVKDAAQLESVRACVSA
jgi:hypothetical protein